MCCKAVEKCTAESTQFENLCSRSWNEMKKFSFSSLFFRRLCVHQFYEQCFTLGVWKTRNQQTMDDATDWHDASYHFVSRFSSSSPSSSPRPKQKYFNVFVLFVLFVCWLSALVCLLPLLPHIQSLFRVIIFASRIERWYNGSERTNEPANGRCQLSQNTIEHCYFCCRWRHRRCWVGWMNYFIGRRQNGIFRTIETDHKFMFSRGIRWQLFALFLSCESPQNILLP